MDHARKTIHIEPGSELDRVLEEAADAPIELEKNGVRYRVSRVDSQSDAGRRNQTDRAYDSILNIIGIGRSKEPTNIAEHELEYLADAIDRARR